VLKKYHYKILLDSDDAPARLLRLVDNNKSVLEIGCASGVQSKVLVEVLGCNVTGIEIDAAAAEEARRFCDSVIVGDIEQLDLAAAIGDRQYDVVILADVLEHLKYPENVLEKIKPFLADDGYVVASIPNIVHASIIYEMTKGNFDYRKFGLLDDTHIRFFTKKTIYQVFERSGFAIAILDREVIAPEYTEFHTTPTCDKDRAVLDYIRINNPESDTYRFIVKAYKSDSGQQAALMSAQMRIEELERTLKGQELRIRQLQSENAWITNRPLYRIHNRVLSFLEKLGFITRSGSVR